MVSTASLVLVSPRERKSRLILMKGLFFTVLATILVWTLVRLGTVACRDSSPVVAASKTTDLPRRSTHFRGSHRVLSQEH